MKRFLSTLLSLCIALFVIEAAVSVVADALRLATGEIWLPGIRGMLYFLSIMVAIITYLMIGVTPMVPKRWFLPLTLFYPASGLLMIPVSIYYYRYGVQFTLLSSFVQLVLGLWVLRAAKRARSQSTERAIIAGTLDKVPPAARNAPPGEDRGEGHDPASAVVSTPPPLNVAENRKRGWPWIREEQLANRGFSGLNLAGFVAVNILLLLPLTAFYLGWCASLAVDHFSEGFLALHSSGLSVQLRDYTRADGKTIRLIPMMHIGESGFYSQVSKSFPSNSVALLEGVSDSKNLLEHKLNYKKMAESLGLSEQHEKFEPAAGKQKIADVDIQQFSKKTIDFLKSAAELHTGGLNHKVLIELSEKSQDPEMVNELLHDILFERNEHLLKEIEKTLKETDFIVVPWGAMHMPGVSHGIEKLGFHTVSKQDYEVLNFSKVSRALNADTKPAAEPPSRTNR